MIGSLIALVFAVLAPAPAPVDFACTVDGVDTLLIENVDKVSYQGAWRVDVEAGFYLYQPKAGELCAVMP